MGKPLCIYHANCADGFTSAWVAWRYFKGECDFHAATHQNPPPDVTGREVYIVDFAYPREVLAKMAARANFIVVLDHHKTAQEDLEDLPKAPASIADFDSYTAALSAVFDMKRSGAGIAWDWFFPGQARPKLIEVVEDRDLWRFQYPTTRDLMAFIFSFPYTFDTWSQLHLRLEHQPEVCALEGQAIERKHHKDVQELVTALQRTMVLGGYEVPVANLPYTLTSDAGHVMCSPTQESGPQFAACYWDTPEGRVFSLRSLADFDVSEIAKSYGGGGHKNAAGFRMPIGWEGDE